MTLLMQKYSSARVNRIALIMFSINQWGDLDAGGGVKNC